MLIAFQWGQDWCEAYLSFMKSVLSVRFEEGVSLLLAPTRADKRGPKAPFPLVENAGIQPAIRKRVPTYPLELRRKPGLNESTVKYSSMNH